MPKRVRVRRDRPSMLSWAVALAATMLAVYLVTLSVPADGGKAAETSAAERVTTQITFAGVEMHFVDMGCWPDVLQAGTAAAKHVVRGAAGCLYRDEWGVHVLGAGYGNLADAERIARQLATGEDIGAQVLTLSAREVAMRVTAPAADAEAIAHADRTLREQLKHAATMALQVDRGELTPAAARMLAAASESELRNAAKGLKGVSGAAENPVCTGMIALLERSAGSFDAAAGEMGASAVLSGRLRACHVDGMLGLIGYLTGLCD